MLFVKSLELKGRLFSPLLFLLSYLWCYSIRIWSLELQWPSLNQNESYCLQHSVDGKREKTLFPDDITKMPYLLALAE